MYADELSNSVQSIDLEDITRLDKANPDVTTNSEDSEETSIQKVSKN